MVRVRVAPQGWSTERYVVAFPIRTLLEPDAADLRTGLARQAAWVVVAVLAARITWVRGLRRYHGAGA